MKGGSKIGRIDCFRSDRGASRQLLLRALGRRFIMLVSVPLMHDGLAAVIVPVRLRFLWRPMLKDPADEMVLETAVNGRADCLVTFNLRHLGAAAEEFGIRATPPGAVWREIKGARYDKE